MLCSVVSFSPYVGQSKPRPLGHGPAFTKHILYMRHCAGGTVVSNINAAPAPLELVVQGKMSK